MKALPLLWGLYMPHILSKSGLSEMLRGHFQRSVGPSPSFIQLRLGFFLGSNNLFEYIGSTDEISIGTTNDGHRRDILDALDRTGALPIWATIMRLRVGERFVMRSTNVPGWSDWFMNTIGQPSESFLIPDTNILMRHYCSNVLFRQLGESNFRELRFRLPRLDILEIERKVNQPRSKESKERRVAFSATTEVMFLRRHGAQLLPSIDSSLLASFSEKAGTQFVDAWIRKEVHDFIGNTSQVYAGNVLFLTCDLMNALAAHAEGLKTCYLSRIDQERFTLETSLSDTEKLAEFVLNAAITFGKIRMDVYLTGNQLSESIELEGVWSGKTPYHWNNDCLRVTRLET